MQILDRWTPASEEECFAKWEDREVWNIIHYIGFIDQGHWFRFAEKDLVVGGNHIEFKRIEK